MGTAVGNMSGVFHTLAVVVQCSCIAVVYSIKSIVQRLFAKKKSLRHETILITGGGRGLGRTLALCLAKEQPKHIVLCGRNVECLKEAQAEIRKLGVDASYFKCDVSSREDIYSMAAAVVEDVGHVTMLVNNAGVVSGKPLLDLSPDELQYCLQVNTLSQVWTIKAFVPSMIDHGHGHIVCINSILGLLALKGTGDYSITKYASTGLMESFCQEMEAYPGIHTTVVHPYQIDNQMFAGMTVRFPKLFPPLKEDYVAEQVVKAVIYNKHQLVLPALFHPVLFFQRILPLSSLLPAQKFLGLDRVMDKFHKADT